MIARRTYVYKLRPTRAQDAALVRTLDACRHVYNNALEHRREVYRATGRSVTRYAQEAELKDVRRLPGWETLAAVHCHPLQDALARLDRSFAGFFRRHRAGERAGFPRFQPVQRYRSFTFKQWGNGVSLDRDRLMLSKVGTVKLRLHRPPAGTPKTATVVRKADGWHVHIVCEVAVEPPDRTADPAVGIDVGIATFATLSTGEQIANPRHADRHRRRVERAQRRVSRRKRGSHRRRKAVALLAKSKQAEARARRDFHHKASRQIVDAHGRIAVEDLTVRNMVRSARGTIEQPGRNVRAKAGLNRSISDAGWAQFVAMLAYKAESAGTQVVKVDPRHTSQTCAQCGVVDPRSRQTQATFRCGGCGHEANADHNAAINILNRARARSVAEAAEDVAA